MDTSLSTTKSWVRQGSMGMMGLGEWGRVFLFCARVTFRLISPGRRAFPRASTIIDSIIMTHGQCFIGTFSSTSK